MTRMTKNSGDWLLVADGEFLSQKKLVQLAQSKYVMVLDGAFNQARAAGLPIDVLLGDFDSIDADDLALARKTINSVVHTPNQNKTDLEKGLDYIDAENAKNITICAAIGKRLQHSLYNLLILKKYHHPQRSLTLISEIEVIRYYENTEITIAGTMGDCVALLGFPQACISTSGLKYEVSDYTLEFEKNSSVCNALSKEQAKIKIRGGVLVIHETNNPTAVPLKLRI